MADPRSPDAYDVQFLVGPEEHVVQANKFVLASSSEVFHRMFFSDFPSESQVFVTDVDAEAFELMVASIYGKDVIIKKANAVQVYYAAEKYGLLFLRRVCRNIIVNSVNSTNALRLLTTFQNFDDAEINGKCLSVILDDPLAFFGKPEFLEAPADVVRSIFKPASINCSAQDVKDALSKWMKKRNDRIIDSTKAEWFKEVENQLKITREELEMKMMRNHLFQVFKLTMITAMTEATTFNLEETHVFLHGFGLCLGKVPQEIITVEISTHKGFTCKLENIIVEKRGPKNVVSNQDVFFEKLSIFHGILTVNIRFVTQHERPYRAEGLVTHLIVSKMLGEAGKTF